MVLVRRLVWDDWNITHIARHDVLPDDVEEVCHNDPMVSETYNDRLRVIGLTGGGDILTVILAPQSDGVYYVITARPASRKERQLYRTQKGGETP
jgi:uncharacterized protein